MLSYILLSAHSQESLDNDGVRLISEVICSATMFLVWDMLLNIGTEVEYIWRTPGRSAMKWLYLFIRHMPYLATGTVCATFFIGPLGTWHLGLCRALVAYDAIVTLSLTVAVDVVLVLRVYAMFNRHRVLLTVLVALFIAYIVGLCVLLAVSIPMMEFTPPSCIVTSTPTTFFLIWFLALAFETILFALTLIKFVAWVMTHGHLGRQSILRVLVRDGTWAYAIVFCALVLSAVMYRTKENGLADVTYPWVLAVISFAGSHVLLNLKKFAIGTHESLLSGVDTQRPPRAPDGELSSCLVFVRAVGEDSESTVAMENLTDGLSSRG
ncbi:hypothetical protein C8Q74DRAFT_964106 [Fomes fomentarius]|nr:hypothetical protein C8Q74DRAFT_964106 [Fomes fomentarius]